MELARKISLAKESRNVTVSTGRFYLRRFKRHTLVGLPQFVVLRYCALDHLWLVHSKRTPTIISDLGLWTCTYYIYYQLHYCVLGIIPVNQTFENEMKIYQSTANKIKEHFENKTLHARTLKPHSLWFSRRQVQRFEWLKRILYLDNVAYYFPYATKRSPPHRSSSQCMSQEEQ